MRFFAEFVTCCGSRTERRGLVAVPETRRRCSRGRMRGGRRRWRPSLSSISEDSVERTAAVWRRRLKRKYV
ncbi:Unknown protein [Striga hermonthica]|uniref:Uncharacterized protein n=1 Tax=Striga hermonthica TaxID=68872 RepID=A0A9N7R5R3_STRHE|nr:Unknown protein [Striga hermonthica]